MSTSPRLKHSTNPAYDEALEFSDDDDDGDDEEVEDDDDAQISHTQTSDRPPRGDTPPSGNMSDSEDGYDHGAEDDDMSESRRSQLRTGVPPQRQQPIRPTPPNAATAATNAATARKPDAPTGTTSQPRASTRTAADSSMGNAGSLAVSGGLSSGRPKQAKVGGAVGGTSLLDDDGESHDPASGDDDVSGASRLRFAAGSKGRGNFNVSKDINVPDELKELFQYITRYKPQEIELEPVLKPFIPDYIPAIGDIDPFIKIPRPDHKPDTLGLTVLDEPAGKQSDPTVLDLHLRAVSKSIGPVPQVVRSIDSQSLRTNPKPLDNWIRNVKDLHATKPPPSVHYSRRMPDIEDLMQVWPAEFEEALETVALPSPELDLPLADYTRLILAILDIPTSPQSSSHKDGKEGKKTSLTGTIEALHVLFTLYSEFKNSQHFRSTERLPTQRDSQMTQ